MSRGPGRINIWVNTRISHTVENGIERIVYTPETRKYETPILMQHGMWHGAWCWEPWQKLFADWGWESHAYSLPGHGKSATIRPVRWCTLGYYDRFLDAEVRRLPVPPVLMGHSMGGALVQRLFKRKIRIAAAVLVASWQSRSTLGDTVRACLRHPLKAVKAFATLSASPAVSTPELVAEFLLSEGSLISSSELHQRLDPESLLIVFQHMPPFWRPATEPSMPLLWLGGTADCLTKETDHRRSAADYGANYIQVQDARHSP